jgi:hypothetical protein
MIVEILLNFNVLVAFTIISSARTGIVLKNENWACPVNCSLVSFRTTDGDCVSRTGTLGLSPVYSQIFLLKSEKEQPMIESV